MPERTRPERAWRGGRNYFENPLEIVAALVDFWVERGYYEGVGMRNNETRDEGKGERR
jgi:hypothetical protein